MFNSNCLVLCLFVLHSGDLFDCILEIILILKIFAIIFFKISAYLCYLIIPHPLLFSCFTRCDGFLLTFGRWFILGFFYKCLFLHGLFPLFYFWVPSLSLTLRSEGFPLMPGGPWWAVHMFRNAFKNLCVHNCGCYLVCFTLR